MTEPTSNHLAQTAITDETESTDPGQPALILPAGIDDAQRWRDRVLALLTAAGPEGMLPFELVDALKANFGRRFDVDRVTKWLDIQMDAGAVVRAGRFWYTAEAAPPAPTPTEAEVEADPGFETEPAEQQLAGRGGRAWSRRRVLGGRS